MKRFLPFVAAAFAVVGLSSCGGDDSSSVASGDTETIEVVMKDIEFEPKVLTVRSGEKVRFLFKNEGKLAHDAFIGDEEAQAEHEATMNSGGESEHGAHGGGGITVEPGDSKQLTHTFDDPGTVLIGCHEVGHYDAGMVIKVTVT